jgi:hypothetical protein
MRIAIDIDSTLHHYWDLLSDAAMRRFGIDLPYEEQLDWGITRLRPHQLHLCIQETHGDDVILAGTPYPDAVETVRRWHDAGHFIHVTSHRDPHTYDATARWLQQIGLPFDDLHTRRRQPREPRPRDRARHHRGHDQPSVEPRPVRGGGRHLRRRLAPARDAPGALAVRARRGLSREGRTATRRVRPGRALG